MSEDTFITEGGNGPELHPVEVRDHSSDPKLTEEPKVEVVSKKRGRPKKTEAKKWRCSTCQEIFDDKNVMKLGAGPNRYAVFCPNCQKSLGFEDQVVLDTVAALIKNNPTGKNAKA